MSLKVKDKEGNIYTLIDEGYKNILNELLSTNNDYFYIENAYIENGIVFINGRVKKGIAGAPSNINFIPLQYAPKEYVCASIIYNSSDSDNGKIQIFRIYNTGKYDMWITNALDYDEIFQFMYPLKTE